MLSCAEPQAPQGGPADKQPPRINSKQYSTPNPSTNFQDNQIILTFDEWIKLQSAYNQVVISPPLDENPDIKIKNKSVVVQWKEKLKDSTTYTINFGDAVRDITESNIVPNLKMVFSTGPFLDSLTCSGQIVGAETRQPKAGVLVMLYNNLEDSVPRTQRPYYFSKTSEQGIFKIEHIRKGQYQIFALEDKNSNYKYDLANEEIAFLDSSFQINDSIQPTLRLTMFKEREETKVFGSKLLHYGCLSLNYNNEIHSPSTIELVDAPNDFQYVIEQGLDTLTLWFDGTMPKTDKWIFVVKNEKEKLLDTVRVSAVEKVFFEENKENLRWYTKQEKQAPVQGGIQKGTQKGPVYVMPPLQDTTRIQQSPFTPIELYFTRSIKSWDTSNIILLKDTTIKVERIKIVDDEDISTGVIVYDTITEIVSIDTFMGTAFFQISQNASITSQLLVQSEWEKGAKYLLMFLPNSVTDYWGYTNPDTLLRVYSIEQQDSYGSITTIINNTDSSMQYVLQLLNAKGVVVQENIFKDSTQIQLVYSNLRTDNYTIRVVHDEYPNGRWDVGDYDTKRQAEKTTTSKVIALKPGWENTMEIDLEEVSMKRK